MKTLKLILILALGVSLAGCTARRQTVFVNPEYDFGLIERVAVVQFENLSGEQNAAGYATRLFVTELLAANVFDIVEPGETARVFSNVGQTRAAELDLPGLKKVADSLNVQAVIFGSVGESSQLTGRATSSHVVSLDARMVDCETGNTVWSAAVSLGGPGSFARMLGVGETTRGNAVQKAVRKLVHSLLE